MTLTVDELDYINFLSVLELNRIIATFLSLLSCVFNEISEALEGEQIVLRVHLIVSIADSVLNDQNLLVFNILCK